MPSSTVSPGLQGRSAGATASEGRQDLLPAAGTPPGHVLEQQPSHARCTPSLSPQLVRVVEALVAVPLQQRLQLALEEGALHLLS